MNYRLKAASGPITGQTFALGESTLVGSSADAEIRIDGLQAEHARIVARDGGLVLQAIGDCVLNGESVREAALTSGDELRFGAVRLVLQAPGLKPVRVLDQVPATGAGQRRWAIVAALVSLAGAAAVWWWLLGRTVE
ncbi:MAG: FHA domain-containing protein [Wenzhouxiangellaceae bacterium]|nr:FHA domain-containing protein [Wenzhouxiangellaceae bacterium]